MRGRPACSKPSLVPLTILLLFSTCLMFKLAAGVVQPPLSASGSSIVDSSGAVVQLRCANWPGHLETLLPEGLQWQSLASLVALLASPSVFNCIRFTYAVDLFVVGANMTARQSLTRLNLTTTIAMVEVNNPALLDLPLLAVVDALVAECEKAGLLVLFDNTVSRAQWCCSTDDGNGWWNDTYFDVDQWLASLQSIASHYADLAPNVVAFSLRNELRSSKSREEQISDWLRYVPMGVDVVHASYPSALIFVSGLNYDCDWTFLNDTQLASYDNSSWARVYQQYAQQLVFETHIYSWDGYGPWTSNCSDVLPALDRDVGFPNYQQRPHVLTEIGLTQDVYPNSETEFLYFQCVSRWIAEWRLGFGVWVFGGSYYWRDGQINFLDSFGLVDGNFTTYKSTAFLRALRNATWEPQNETQSSERAGQSAMVRGGLSVID